MFQPTHWLVSRSRKIPVSVRSHGEKSLIFTEGEWDRTETPAFELHSKLGMFCRGVQVLGYELQPIATAVSTSVPTPVEAQ